jgi:hypothetical protein
LTAVDNSGGETDGNAVPQANDAHNRNVSLVCTGPKVREVKGPDFWVIQCDYDLQGAPPLAGDVNPLSLPTQFTWGTVTTETEVDTDAGGRLICNSAGDVIKQGRPYALKSLRARKAFTLFDPVWWTLENTVNTSAVNIDGITVAAEHMVCKTINPEPYYKSAWNFLWVNFEFEVCLSAKLLGVNSYPFAIRLLDSGANGWWSDSGTKRKARFSDGKGRLIDDEVLLDGTGLPLTPLFASVKVGETNAAPTTPPSALAAYQTDTGTGTPPAKWRYFEKYPKANHAALPIW